jgi:3-hydroxybutyryl-CoA dehydratase
MGKYNINDIKIGMKESYSKVITQEMVNTFGEITGDKNPIHMDEDYASKSRFKKRIAHGLLSAAFFSAIFGTKIPGEGCVYVSQSLQFLKPVYIGDEVIAITTVYDVDIENRRVFFDTVCKVKNKNVIIGRAELYITDKENND